MSGRTILIVGMRRGRMTDKVVMLLIDDDQLLRTNHGN